MFHALHVINYSPNLQICQRPDGLLHLALQDLDQSVPLLTVFKLETSGQSVQVLEREVLHGLDKVVVEVIRDPSVQRTSERVLLVSIS